MERIKAALHGGQPGGRGDVNERSGSGKNIACLSQAANGVGSGQGNGLGGLSAGRCCLRKDGSGALAAIGHRQGGHRGVGKRLAYSHSNAGCGLGRGGGAFKRVWGDDNMHARNYKARVQWGTARLKFRTVYRKYLSLLWLVKGVVYLPKPSNLLALSVV